MKILWLTWKDCKHPLAGGAEIVNEQLAKRLVQDGHEVIFIVGGFGGGSSKDTRDGYNIVRVGNRWSVYWQAYKYYKKNLKDWPDLVIDEVNTIPFFSKFYVRQKNILFVHQLCRQIWFYQMFFPLNIIGYLIEPLYLRSLNDRKVITVSKSTKNDLMKYGFKENNISIISEGIEIEPLQNIDSVAKYSEPTILALGAIRKMKRTNHIIRAFELAKERIDKLHLIIAGDSSDKYGQKLIASVKRSRYAEDIQYLGKVSREKKIELLQKCNIIAVTSVKEGWGLIVTEANSQGTPAVVYNVDGLRDAVRDGQTGQITTNNTPRGLASHIVQLLNDKSRYETMRREAWEWSKEINFDQGYEEFSNILKYV